MEGKQPPPLCTPNHNTAAHPSHTAGHPSNESAPGSTHAIGAHQSWGAAPGCRLPSPSPESTTSAYSALLYLVTALVPSLTACLASSPGSTRRTAVWISRLVMVARLL